MFLSVAYRYIHIYVYTQYLHPTPYMYVSIFTCLYMYVSAFRCVSFGLSFIRASCSNGRSQHVVVVCVFDTQEASCAALFVPSTFQSPGLVHLFYCRYVVTARRCHILSHVHLLWVV